MKRLLLLLAAVDSGFSRLELEALLKAHHPGLLAFLRFKCGQADLAEELAQETWLAFLAASLKPGQFARPEAVRAYLLTTGLNKLRDHWRRTGTRHRHQQLFASTEALDLCLERLESPLPSPEATLVSEADRQAVQTAVAVALGRIKPDHQRILHLRFHANLSLQAAAEQMGLGLKAAESLLVRAKAAFRREFEKTALKEKGFAAPVVYSTSPDRREDV